MTPATPRKKESATILGDSLPGFKTFLRDVALPFHPFLPAERETPVGSASSTGERRTVGAISRSGRRMIL
jgi:hypothetical protein